MVDGICYACGVFRRHVIRNHPTNLNICGWCHVKVVTKSNLNRADKDPRVWYKGKQVRVASNPKIGVCNLCRAVVPFDTKRTHIHHEQHHEYDPIGHTLEICIVCHNMISGFKPNGKFRGDFGYYQRRY